MDDIWNADREQVVDEEELIDYILLTSLFGVNQLFPLIFLDALLCVELDVLDKELSIARKVLSSSADGLDLLSVHRDLTQEMQILNIALFVDLSNFEVVDLLDHLLELSHHFVSLRILSHAALLEHALYVFGDVTLGELEVLAHRVLPFEDCADENFHAQSDDRFFICAVYFNRVGELEDSLKEASFNQAGHELTVSEPVKVSLAR